MTKRAFAIEQDKEIAILYQSGLSSIKLAKQYDVGKGAILNALDRQGVQKRRSTKKPKQTNITKGLKTFGSQLLTPSETDQAYKIYQYGYTLNQISQAYGFGKNGRGLSEAFKRQGYKTRGGKKLIDKQENEAIKLYKNGLSSTQVAKKLNVSKNVIKNTLRRTGTKTRNKTIVYKYSANEDVFSKIDNEISAYILGFIYADGTVSDNKVMRISISEKDKELLEKINKLMNSNYPIYTSKRTSGYKPSSNLVTLQINNPKLVKDLMSCGVIVGRSQFFKTEQKLYPEIKSHFIRGYLDGDGCIRGNYNPSVTFVGQLDILEWIRKVFHNELNTNPNLSIPKGKGIYYINFSGIHQATKICNWLYKDATIWLDRKREKFDSWGK